MLPSAIHSHLSKDPVLAELMDTFSYEPPKASGLNLFEYLTRVIIYQQLSGKAAESIHGRYLALFKDTPYRPEAVLTMEHETLRSAGLSNQKARYVKAIAEYIASKGDLDGLHQMEDDALLKELTAIKGIGTWTAKMTLLVYFERPDILPHEDLTIRQAIAALYQLEGAGKTLISRIEAVASVWRPYRSYACRYFWLWKDAN